MSASTEDIRNSPVVTKNTFTLDTKFRTSGSINMPIFDLGVTIENVQLIDIRNVTFTNIINNINQNNNKVNWIDSQGVTQFNELTPGNYNLTSLQEGFGNVFSENDSGGVFYTVTFDTLNSTLTVSNTIGATFSLLFGVSSDENVGRPLGFGVTNLFGITSATGSKSINLTTSKSVFVGSTLIIENSSDRIIVSSGVSNIAYEVYNDNIYGTIINNGDRLLGYKSVTPYTLSSIDFSFIDDNGNLLVIPDTVNEDAIGGIFKVTIDVYSGIFDLTYYD